MSAVRKPLGRTPPQLDDTAVSVSVTPAERGRSVIDNEPAPLEFNPDPATVAQIRDSLPSAPSANLTACRHARVLDQEAAFLTDDSGTIEPPEREEVINACRFAAEYMRDQIVVGGSRA